MILLKTRGGARYGSTLRWWKKEDEVLDVKPAKH